MENSGLVRDVYGNPPSFFKAACIEASKGGINSYYNVGCLFAKSIHQSAPYTLNFEEWDQEIEILKKNVLSKRDDEVFHWLNQVYLKLMKLVPSKRRKQFLDGFCYGIDNYC